MAVSWLLVAASTAPGLLSERCARIHERTEAWATWLGSGAEEAMTLASPDRRLEGAGGKAAGPASDASPAAAGSSGRGEAVAAVLTGLGQLGLPGWAGSESAGRAAGRWQLDPPCLLLLGALRDLGCVPDRPQDVASARDVPPTGPVGLVGLSVAAAVALLPRAGVPPTPPQSAAGHGPAPPQTGPGSEALLGPCLEDASAWAAAAPTGPAGLWGQLVPAAAGLLRAAQHRIDGHEEALDHGDATTDEMMVSDRLALPAADPVSVAHAVADLCASVARICDAGGLTMLRWPPPAVKDLVSLEEAAQRRAANLPPSKRGRQAAGTFVPPEVRVLSALLSRATQASSEAEARAAGLDFARVMGCYKERERVWLGRALLTLTPLDHEAIAVVDVLRRTVAAAAKHHFAAAAGAAGAAAAAAPVALRSAACGGAAGILDDLVEARVRCIARAIDDAKAAEGEDKEAAGAALAAAAEPLASVLQLVALLLGVEARAISRLPGGSLVSSRLALGPGGAADSPAAGAGTGGRAAASLRRTLGDEGSAAGTVCPCLRATYGSGRSRHRRFRAFVDTLTASLAARQARVRSVAGARPRGPALPGVVAEMESKAAAAGAPARVTVPAAALRSSGEAGGAAAARDAAREMSSLLILEAALTPVKEALAE